MDSQFKIPFYAKGALVFIFMFGFIYTLRIGQHLIVPLVYATLIAILLNPVVNFLVRKRVKKVLAIAIAVLVAIILVAGIIYVVSTQVSIFNEFYPKMRAKFSETSATAVQWVSAKFNISSLKINSWLKATQQKIVSGFALGQTLLQVGRTTATVILLPVYLFMILYYKELLVEFTRKLFSARNHKAVDEILGDTKSIVQSYLVGLFFEMVIIAVLNSVGLLILGIDYAIILGITGALLNIIPYLGALIAIALPVTIAFVTKDSYVSPLLVFCMYLVIQFVDNNYIVPKIVASRVKINALFSIIVVLIGGTLWGIPGMFLALPLTAIFRVICEHVESLRPFGFLLGNVGSAPPRGTH